MPNRTTAKAVADILNNNYDPRIQLTPFIQTASVFVDDLVTEAATQSVPFSTGKRELVERWLAAYFYTVSDALYTSSSAGGASGSFLRDGNEYLKTAAALDPTNTLMADIASNSAKGMWAGTEPSGWVDYDSGMEVG